MSLLIDYISSIQALTKVSSTEYKTNCLFCSDTRGRFYINSVNDLCYCFNCDFKGNYITTVAAYEGITKQAVRDKTKTRVQIKDTSVLLEDLKPETPRKLDNYIEQLYTKFQPITPGSPVALYLKSRGVPFHIAKAYKMKEGVFINSKEDYSNRVILPIFENGLCVYFQGRDITGSSFLKIKNPIKQTGSSIGKSECVFNLDRIKEYSRIIVCEGPFDALNVGEDAVAIGGKSISKTQFSKILQKHPQEVVILLDLDAVLEAVELAYRFSGYYPTSLVFIESKDPGEASQVELKEAISNRCSMTKEVYDVFKNTEF